MFGLEVFGLEKTTLNSIWNLIKLGTALGKNTGNYLLMSQQRIGGTKMTFH